MLLIRHVQDGRQALREVLTKPLRFTPEGRTYRFEGEAAIGRLVAGIAGLPTNLVAVRGSAPLRNPVLAVALDFSGNVQLAA